MTWLSAGGVAGVDIRMCFKSIVPVDAILERGVSVAARGDITESFDASGIDTNPLRLNILKSVRLWRTCACTRSLISATGGIGGIGIDGRDGTEMSGGGGVFWICSSTPGLRAPAAASLVR